MNEKRLRQTLFILGIFISVASIAYALLGNKNWYFPAVLGVWFFFDYLASTKSKKTTLQVLIKDKKKFAQIFFLLILLGGFIEYTGRILFGWWIYPAINSLALETFLILFYPFILMSFRESYVFFKEITSSKILAYLLAVISGMIIWEIPNLYSGDWIYSMPLAAFIVGWFLLIWASVYIYSALEIK